MVRLRFEEGDARANGLGDADGLRHGAPDLAAEALRQFGQVMAMFIDLPIHIGDNAQQAGSAAFVLAQQGDGVGHEGHALESQAFQQGGPGGPVVARAKAADCGLIWLVSGRAVTALAA